MGHSFSLHDSVKMFNQVQDVTKRNRKKMHCTHNCVFVDGRTFGSSGVDNVNAIIVEYVILVFGYSFNSLAVDSPFVKSNRTVGYFAECRVN